MTGDAHASWRKEEFFEESAYACEMASIEDRAACHGLLQHIFNWVECILPSRVHQST